MRFSETSCRSLPGVLRIDVRSVLFCPAYEIELFEMSDAKYTPNMIFSSLNSAKRLASQFLPSQR